MIVLHRQRVGRLDGRHTGARACRVCPRDGGIARIGSSACIRNVVNTAAQVTSQIEAGIGDVVVIVHTKAGSDDQ